MNEINEYFDGVIAKIKMATTKSGVDADGQVARGFEELRDAFVTKYAFEKVDMQKVKKEVKDVFFEGVEIRSIKDKYTRYKTAIALYAILDYKWEKPNSPKAIAEICKDLGMSFSTYLYLSCKFIFEHYDTIAESSQKKRN